MQLSMSRERGRGGGRRFGYNNGFENPTIAASVKVQRKEWEAEVTRKMQEFAQSNESSLTFPAMDNMQRKRVHELAVRYGLLSHSEGRDPARFVVLQRKKRLAPVSAFMVETNPIILSPTMKKGIKQLVKRFSIHDFDIATHLSMGMAMKSKRINHRPQYKRQTSMIIPPSGSNAPSHLLEQRKKLPAYKMKTQILEAIERNRVVLITGGTGCGKTTQVPQFILEDACAKPEPIRIICTQPRRLPAVAVAERVAKERGEDLGNTVGYHIRLEQKISTTTVLTYCTSGVLLRMLTQEDVVKNLSHIILDEIHEREINTDYLLIALKQAMKKDNHLKIVLMSATMEGNLDMFKKYFGDVPVEHIDIPSRLYEVEKLFLGDILALTGYTPPDSIFCSGAFSQHETTHGFPQMTTWGEQEDQVAVTQPPVKPSFELGQQYNTPPPQPRVVQNVIYEQVAQQLANAQPVQSTAIPQDQQQSVPVQSGLHHAATWASGMDANYSQYVPDVIEHPSTNDDYMALRAEFGDGVVGAAPTLQFTTPPPPIWSYNPEMTTQMQYFNHPMDGRISYPLMPTRTMSQSMLGAQLPNRNDSAQFGLMTQFGRAILEEKVQHERMKQLLATSFPHRKNQFDPAIISQMRSVLGDTESLADAYWKLGGVQYADSVDVDLITHIATFLMDSHIEGAILIFLPGCDDISEVKEKLTTACERKPGIRPIIYTLHSQMNTADQHKVFERASPGKRKVILSTNIAEASLTIDDVVFVIDTGKVKEKTYDHDSRISQLKVAWIAKSNAEQRAGRAGRCRPGFCFRLYSKTEFGKMAATQRAEMQRAAIHEVCLHAKIFAPENMSVCEFLSLAPEPPPTSAIENSMTFLEQLGALYSEASTSDVDIPETGKYFISKEAEMTDLGLIIVKLPLDPQLARMLVFGLALKVLAPVVTLVAVLSHRDPFIIPLAEDREKCNKTRDQFGGMDFSDHLSILRAICQYEECIKYADQINFCKNNYLSFPAMKMILGIRKQLLGELKRANLITDINSALVDPEYNRYADCWPMVQAAITAGCYPGVGYTKSNSKLRKIRTNYNNNAGLHPSSIIKRQIFALSKKENNHEPGPVVEYLSFQELAQLDEGLTLKTVTVIPPITMLIMTGSLRLKQSLIKDYNIICDKDSLETEEQIDMEDEKQRNENQPDFGVLGGFNVMAIEESWLACKGPVASFRSLLRLRFMVMQYFLDVIADPTLFHKKNDKNDTILETLAYVLTEDHQRQGFKTVNAVDYYNLERLTDRKNYAEQQQRRYQSQNDNQYKNESQFNQQKYPQEQYVSQNVGYHNENRFDNYQKYDGYYQEENKDYSPDDRNYGQQRNGDNSYNDYRENRNRQSPYQDQRYREDQYRYPDDNYRQEPYYEPPRPYEQANTNDVDYRNQTNIRFGTNGMQSYDEIDRNRRFERDSDYESDQRVYNPEPRRLNDPYTQYNDNRYQSSHGNYNEREQENFDRLSDEERKAIDPDFQRSTYNKRNDRGSYRNYYNRPNAKYKKKPHYPEMRRDNPMNFQTGGFDISAQQPAPPATQIKSSDVRIQQARIKPSSSRNFNNPRSRDYNTRDNRDGHDNDYNNYPDRRDRGSQQNNRNNQRSDNRNGDSRSDDRLNDDRLHKDERKQNDRDDRPRNDDWHSRLSRNNGPGPSNSNEQRNMGYNNYSQNSRDRDNNGPKQNVDDKIPPDPIIRSDYHRGDRKYNSGRGGNQFSSRGGRGFTRGNSRGRGGPRNFDRNVVDDGNKFSDEKIHQDKNSRRPQRPRTFENSRFTSKAPGVASTQQ